MYVCMYVYFTCTTYVLRTTYYITTCDVRTSRDAHQDLAKIGDLDSSSDRIK